MIKPAVLKVFVVAFAAMAIASLPARAFNVVIDYTYDTDNYIRGNTAAQMALERAASDLSAVITTSLNATGSGTYAGQNGEHVTMTLQGRNPSTVASVTTNLPFQSNANEFRIFVGAVNYGTGGTLGAGSPAWVNLDTDTTNQISSLETAFANATTDMMRGTNMSIMTWAPYQAPWDVPYTSGLMAGTFFFNKDVNWHYDHTSNVAFSEYDFYSVALHEMLHTIGVGTSENWESLWSGDGVWTGAKALAEANGEDHLVYVGGTLGDGSYGAHIADGVQSTSIVDSALQDPAMTYSIYNGKRKFLTALDLAFLEDLGFTVDYNAFAAVPEPATFALLFGGVMLAVVWARRRQ